MKKQFIQGDTQPVKKSKGLSSLSTIGGDQIYLNKDYFLFLDGCTFVFV